MDMPKEEGSRSRFRGKDRRAVLKGMSAGALAFPFMTGTTAAQQDMGLRVSVEAGEGDEENWTPRDRITDDFRAKVDISGLSGRTKVAVMTFPVGGSNYVSDGQLRSKTVQPDGSSDSVIHTTSWSPSGIFSWDAGTYYLYTVVAEDREESFGASVSDPFEVAP
jgi:hypothetical protein